MQVNDRKAEERLKVEKEKIADKLAEQERLMVIKRAKAEARRLDMERNNEVIAHEIEAKARTKAEREVARAAVRDERHKQEVAAREVARRIAKERFAAVQAAEVAAVAQVKAEFEVSMRVAAERFERYQERKELKRARNFEKAKAKVAELEAALARVAAAVEKTRLEAAAKDAALAERYVFCSEAHQMPWPVYEKTSQKCTLEHTTVCRQLPSPFLCA